jgi:hypothetical protein
LAEFVGEGPRFPGLAPPRRADPDLPTPDQQHPRAGVRVRRRRRLQSVAAVQHGLFTVDQARDAGLDRRARHHHLSYGNWRRSAAPGVLRLCGWPDDEHEDHRAWLLWGGPGAALTSWTALELHRVTVAGPRAPIELGLPAPRTDEEHRARVRQVDRLSSSGSVHRPPPRLHRSRHRAPVTEVDGLRVLPIADALCAAAAGSPSTAIPLVDHLIERGRVDRHDVFDVALRMQPNPLLEHLFRRTVA